MPGGGGSTKQGKSILVNVTNSKLVIYIYIYMCVCVFFASSPEYNYVSVMLTYNISHY